METYPLFKCIIYMELDIKFIEFYIKMKYGIKLHEYFGVTATQGTDYRRKGKLPINRLNEFQFKEKTIDINELFNVLYPGDQEQEADIHLIELYLKMIHNQKLHEYFKITNSSASEYRTIKFPDGRKYELLFNEKLDNLNISTIIEKIS